MATHNTHANTQTRQTHTLLQFAKLQNPYGLISPGMAASRSAVMRPLELIVAILDNACDTTRHTAALFRCVPEAGPHSALRKIRSIFDVKLHRAVRATGVQ